MKSITKVMVVTVAMLLAAALLVAPAAARDPGIQDIESGDTIYVGESGLDLTALGDVTRLVKYDDFGAGTIARSIVVGDPEDFDLRATAVGGQTGQYFAWDADGLINDTWVFIEEPDTTLDVRVYTATTSDSVDGRTVSRGVSDLRFRLNNNLADLYDNSTAQYRVTVTTPTGGRITNLAGTPLTINVTGDRATTDSINLSGLAPGTYTAFAEPLGHLDDLPDTNTVSFTIGARLVALDITADSVVRNNNFAVTITGESRGDYLLYVREVTGLDDDEYPQIVTGQTGVTEVGSADDLGVSAVGPVNANVQLNAAGTRTVEFSTNSSTDARTYTIYVRDVTAADTRFDSVRVRVEEGAVTILAE
ncbi:MAG: DUF3821 domain-containing protein, partial [Methanomicrobiaceae archaeon]|nr:DUF3821 domain-containing protein [Methanomicrobiaceae archaeon]